MCLSCIIVICVMYCQPEKLTLASLSTVFTGVSLHKYWLLSWVQLFATPWAIAHQAPLSMGFPRQEYLSG